MPLPRWMRTALLATAAMNFAAVSVFLPVGDPLRAWLGLPGGAHPLYLATIALFVGLFGMGYLWAALSDRAERVFIRMAAVGKLSFVALLIGFWLAGAIPARAPGAAAGDVVFGVLFVVWLVQSRASP
jgi:hypothetical protein